MVFNIMLHRNCLSLNDFFFQKVWEEPRDPAHRFPQPALPLLAATAAGIKLDQN